MFLAKIIPLSKRVDEEIHAIARWSAHKAPIVFVEAIESTSADFERALRLLPRINNRYDREIIYHEFSLTGDLYNH